MADIPINVFSVLDIVNKYVMGFVGNGIKDAIITYTVAIIIAQKSFKPFGGGS